MATRPDNVPNHSDILRLLVPISDKWEHIGLALEVDHHIINGLRGHETDNTIRLSKILQAWIDIDKNITWETVAQAIEGPIVNNKALAREIRDRYISTVSDLPSSTSQTTTTIDGAQPVTQQLTDEPEMRDLARLLHPVKPQWRAIGRQLGIEGYELDSIGRNPTLSDSDKLTEVCQLWKDKKTTEISWRKILGVIRNRPIHNKDVCQQIEKFLGIEPAQMSSSMETNQPTGTGESVSMQSSMTETAQEEEKSQPLRRRRINSQDRPVDDINMNQSEDVSPSESSKCGTCYKLIYACLIGIILLACMYLGYTYYYKEIDTSNTDSILFTPKQLVAIAIAITALISVLLLYVWNNGITKEKLNEILLNIVNNYLARILLIVIICIIAGNTKTLKDQINKWQTG